MRCSSDAIHIRTCSDSCAALMNLIQYIASYGDLLPPSGLEAKCRSTKLRVKVSLIEEHFSVSFLITLTMRDTVMLNI